jgi:hypothetical protein
MCVTHIPIDVYIISFLILSKNIVKGTTQVSGHSLNLYFCMFEKSQLKHNNLDCHKKFKIFSINGKVYMLKVWHKSKIF